MPYSGKPRKLRQLDEKAPSSYNSTKAVFMDFVSGEVLASVYGPIRSRRHGLSLGVNVGLTGHKVCTWSCLYCQCGFGERRDYTAEETRIGHEPLLAQIKETLLQNDKIETVTFAGNTEPGTYPELLPLVKGLLRFRLMNRAKWKLIILSNGSELDRDEVVRAFDSVDETWLKLDCGNEKQFHFLNRPIHRVGTLREHLERLKKVKTLRLQTLIWANPQDPKTSNSNEENLASLLECYTELKPVQIHLTTVARDPAMPGIAPVEESVLQSFAQRIQILGISVQVLGV